MAAVGCASFARRASAEPLRVRGDAIAEARSPSGLVVLQGQDRKYPWVDAEALVWAGARTDPTADVLTLTLKLRAPRGLGELRLGRFVFSSGAIRPMPIDGASAIGRAPWGLSAEAFAGLPVVPRFAATGRDQVAGARLAQTVTSKATLGVSYVEQRLRGRLANQEVGADFAAVPIRRTRYRRARRVRHRLEGRRRRPRLGRHASRRLPTRSFRLTSLSIASPASDIALFGSRRHAIAGPGRSDSLGSRAAARSLAQRRRPGHRRKARGLRRRCAASFGSTRTAPAASAWS